MHANSRGDSGPRPEVVMKCQTAPVQLSGTLGCMAIARHLGRREIRSFKRIHDSCSSSCVQEMRV